MINSVDRDVYCMNDIEISCTTEEVEVDIVAESQRPQMTYPNLITC